MTIELRPELEERIRERMADSDCASVDAFVEQMIEIQLGMHFDEFGSESDDVTEAVAQFERGESFPAEEVLARFRAKHGISD